MEKHPATVQQSLKPSKDSDSRERSSKNARTAVRYEVCAPVVFTWIDATGTIQERRGYTRDISPKGAFVVSPACPPAGTSLEMSIYLSVASEHSRDVRIEAQACVLRLEPGTAAREQGFSVRNHWVRYGRVE